MNNKNNINPKTSVSLPSWVTQFFDGVYAQCDLVWDQSMKEQVAGFIINSKLMWAPQLENRFFDQCCGRGDLSHALSAHGWSGVGVDQSASYVAHALQHRVPGTHDHVSFVSADAGTFVLDPPADVGISWHTSLGYGGVQGAQALLSCLHESVRPNGLYVLDLRNLEHYIQQPLLQEKIIDLPSLGQVRLHRQGSWEGHVLTQRWSLFDMSDKLLWEQDNASCFHPSLDDVVGLCRTLSDEILGVFGGLDHRPVCANDPRMIVVVRRGAS